ncbi:SusC/RagA family TonB-linked outer membrane protein (plasmid) [Pedobacter sp. BS3]|uniref:SusC/RagA family TonB-linked outer membrane protein n=1 Tax=Pedobacter sp. BS3 TaxID=2567937 RepID=UPI0011F05E4D|nr:SusC/RagA family TonB-linked outer membrane protein [Pedobacter sp. BS3]TZF85961.1 SusC/RagA family TonB-linked outer membrane protein [Pedobacter sp. BS3]
MKKLLSSLFILLIVSVCAVAQERTITGTVTDSQDGSPLPGVSIKIKGTTVGTQTGPNGTYSIKAPSSAVLVFTYIGYASKEITVGTSNVISTSLSLDTKQLGEVVVTALGIKREKKSLGYSVQNVDGDEIVSSREPNIVNALAGKVAGVQINNSGGQAGSSSRITIRGNTSINGNNEPLFVIDGIPVDNSTNRGISENTESALFNGYGSNRAIDIDPNIIESISVLKGASASALYGSRGAFGVILITTKKGEKDLNRRFPKVSFSSNASFDNAITDGYQTSYLQGSLGLYKSGLPVELGGYAETGATQTSASWGPHKDSVSQNVINAIGMPKIIDPRKEFYRTGTVYNNSISLSGGGDKSSYIVSYSNLSQNGIVPNNTFKKNSFTANFTSNLSKNFTTSTSVSYINSVNHRFSEGNGARSFTYGLNFAPISFDIKEAYEKYGNLAWTANNNYTTGFNNPFWIVNNNSLPSVVDRMIISNELNYQILPWLKLTNRVGLDSYTDQQSERININTISVPNGRMFEAAIKQRQINNDLILSADKKINDDLSFTALLGNNINDRLYARRTIRGLDLSVPGYYDITNAETVQSYQLDSRRRLIGLYAAGSLDYKEYLFLNLTARNDWSSTLPKKNNSFFYPSASVGFVFSDLLGLSNNKYFSYGKLRLSYAQAGNDADPYLVYQTYSQANPSDGTRGEIIFPYNGINGFLLSNVLANSDLTPEKVTETEIGTDLRFFRNRLGIEFSYYDKVSKDQILLQEVASSGGYSDKVINGGEVSNRGVELVVTATPVKSKNFTWDILLNYAKNNYKLKSLAEGIDNIFLGGFSTPQIRVDKKYGYGVIWGQGYKTNSDGKLLIDDDGYPILSDELGPIGNVTPDWTGGIRNTFTYKGLSLSTLFDIKQGGDILNLDLYYSTYYGTAKVTEQRNTTKVWDGIRESDGKANTIPVLQDQSYFQNFYSYVDQNFVEDGSFVKLREITLSYSLPKSLIQKSPFESVSFSVTGRNLWIKSDFSYLDPEGSLLGDTNSQGLYHAITPGTRGWTFGLNVKF